MATKLGRKELPNGHTQHDFKYMGRPAKTQDDFGTDVGLADCNCVNQFGEANNSKYYHAGVVQSLKTNAFFAYYEWGRNFSGKSWNGGFAGQDFQFVVCSTEAEARKEFSSQLQSKNTKRLVQQNIGGKMIWTAKAGADGYFVQSLATRERGLPDAYTIKDSTGVAVAAPATTATPTIKVAAVSAPVKTYHPQVVKLAQDLVGGVTAYTRSLTQATGIVPSMDAIVEVRDTMIPLALGRIKAVGTDVTRQIADPSLRDISRAVFSMVPRYIPRTGITDEMAILSSNNILSLEQDLDTFEASLKAESFDTKTTVATVDPAAKLNAELTWLDPNTAEGQAVIAALLAQTNNRHGYLNNQLKVKNVFRVTRPDRDAQFMANVNRVAGLRKGNITLRANLQPTRHDLAGAEANLYREANVILTQHGTRSVNIHPIMSTHFRMPKQLTGVPIAGANFGHGTYTATDYKKAVGYTSHSGAAWSAGGGGIQSRGAFMFMCDTLMGDAYRAPSTGSWDSPPNGKDSVFGVGGDRGHGLQNDEHVVFNPHYNRIRYLIEFTF